MLVMSGVLTQDRGSLVTALHFAMNCKSKLGVLDDCLLDTVDNLRPIHCGLQLGVDRRVFLSGFGELLGHIAELEVVVPLFHHLPNQ